MSGARLRALVLLVAGLVGAAALALVGRGDAPPPQPPPRSDKPPLLLLTSLPLLFGEGFSLEGGGSPALDALRTRYRVVPISATDAGELGKGRLLLMAHPLAQTAENLVALDAWVRRGGHVLLLADPMLEWPSERPLGDPLRPPPMFADTGLLAHWGLRLDAPGERGPRMALLGGGEVLTGSPGRLAGSACNVAGDGLVARCLIGKGEATVVADADFLNVADLDGPTQHNLGALLAELAALEGK